jgi:hypothetical protein
MARLIIGFGHKRRRGKDLCGEIACRLLREQGRPVRQDWFAASLKEMARVVFGFDQDQLYGDRKFEVDPFWGFTPRWALQVGGTEAMRRVFGEDIWVKTLERRALANPETSVVVCDLRFPNEAEAIHRIGGLAIKVERPAHLLPPATSPDEDTHLSETALDGYDGWDAVILNDGTVDQLAQKVQAIVSSTT